MIGTCNKSSFIWNQSVWNNKHVTKSGSPSMTLHYQKKVLITSRIFLTPLHVILNHGMKLKASSDFHRDQSMIIRWYSIILSIPRDW